MGKKVSIFCTLGPSSMDKKIIIRLDAIGIDMFRINLSHTNIRDLENIIKNIKQATDKPVCIDTEGAQIRVGYVENGAINLPEGSMVEICGEKMVGNTRKIPFYPLSAIGQIRPGDLISIDFDSVLLQALYCSQKGVTAKVVSGGRVGSNKAVTVDRPIDLPVMTEKDIAAVKIALKNGIRHFALSFAASRDSVELFRKAAGGRAHIISKVESRKGVENLDDILKASDAILIDRGDLSREEPIEKIPLMQKLIIKKANRARVPVYVATNLLESMVTGRTPTRAELNDVVNTLLDGADGLVLAAETAIGRYPVNCAAMIAKTVKQLYGFSDAMSLTDVQKRESFLLSEPHGGRLVSRQAGPGMTAAAGKIKKIVVDDRFLMDAEQIAVGTFSPLEGFMTKKELESVLDDYRLPGGVVWPLPVFLQVDENTAKTVKGRDRVLLSSASTGKVHAALYPDQVYLYDIERMSLKMFGTNDPNHPGVERLKNGGKYFLGGKIDLIMPLPSPNKHYELRPRQARLIFEAKGWTRVVGFHTRNVIHRVHEHIQLLAMEKHHCDGVFIHPVVGPKKAGDYVEDVILKSYGVMIDRYYPAGKVVLGAFQSYSRYAGPREAVFTALCRKNFGCSHFVVGRDHTGVADYYKPYDVHRLFDRLGDIGITPIFFKEQNYCRLCGTYVERCRHQDRNILRISGSKGREILKSGKRPPEWFMRPEISDIILENIRKGEDVFIG
ncbi:MAG: sulfate adenylyltransferase [Candidatus Omnitrophota bacterium]